MDRSDQIDQLATALALAQGAMGPALKSSKAEVRSKRDGVAPYSYSFADLDAVWDAARGPLSANGLSVVQLPEAEGDRIVLTTLLMHASGQWIKSTLPLIFEGLGMQPLGSAITFGRRYAFSAVSGVTCEDDDGASTATAATPASSQSTVGSGLPSQARSPSRDPGPSNVPPEVRKTGLFGWLKDQEKVHGAGLIKHIESWGKSHDFPWKMKEWDETQVAEAYDEALRKLATLADAA